VGQKIKGRKKRMKITKTQLKALIREVVKESHTKADEEKLKKISKQLKKSTKMHGQQADDLDNIVDRSDDKKLGEDVSPPAGSKELYSKTSFGEESLSPEQIEDFATEIADEVRTTDGRREKVAHKKMRKLGLSPTSEDFIRLMDRVDSILDRSGMREGVNNGKISKSYLSAIIKEEYQAVLDEKKKKKACKPAKGKRFAKRVNGKCRSYGQAGKAKGGGDRIRPGTKKGDAYCARSAKIKKCKNPPCANDLSRKKWKCRGSKSMK
jgi:hypothetical protein